MIGFWVAAALLAAGAAALMLHRAARGGAVARAPDPQVDVYRRALGEIDDLAERDLLGVEERRNVRAEAARRLLGAADREIRPINASGRPTLPLTACAAVAIGAVAVYLATGSPGLADQPFSARLADWKANPAAAPPAALAAMLEAVANERPDDVTPLRKLAALDLGLGDADGAAHALRRAMMIAPSDAGLPAMLGEIKVLQGGGTISPDARALFERSLSDDPNEPAARYYVAKAKISDGDTAGGLAQWRALLATLPPTDTRRPALAQQIADVERTGRLAPAPSSEERPPPAELTDAIRGMVDGLAARLSAHPDDPPGWVRLVRAYAVLGETDKRDKALSAARARYAGRPDEMSQLAAAASTPATMASGR